MHNNLNIMIMKRLKNFIARAKYNWECIKLAPFAMMYKDEAEASREIISNLKAQNRILSEQYKTQAATIERLLKTAK